MASVQSSGGEVDTGEVSGRWEADWFFCESSLALPVGCKRPGNCISPNARDLGTVEMCELRKSSPIHSG